MMLQLSRPDRQRRGIPNSKRGQREEIAWPVVTKMGILVAAILFVMTPFFMAKKETPGDTNRPFVVEDEKTHEYWSPLQENEIWGHDWIMALAYVHNQNVIAKGTETSSSDHHYFIYAGVCMNKEHSKDKVVKKQLMDLHGYIQSIGMSHILEVRMGCPHPSEASNGDSLSILDPSVYQDKVENLTPEFWAYLRTLPRWVEDDPHGNMVEREKNEDTAGILVVMDEKGQLVCSNDENVSLYTPNIWFLDAIRYAEKHGNSEIKEFAKEKNISIVNDPIEVSKARGSGEKGVQTEDGKHDREENDYKLLRDQALGPNYVSFVNDGNEATKLQNAIMNSKVIITGECNGDMGPRWLLSKAQVYCRNKNRATVLPPNWKVIDDPEMESRAVNREAEIKTYCETQREAAGDLYT